MILRAGIKGKDEFWIVVGVLFTASFISLTINIISDVQNTQPEPTALDVYRGLTELEITSVNGIPQDTVVVFKK